MKIGIYGPYFGTLGGGELYLGTIAEALSRDHEVQIVSETEIDRDAYASYFGLDLRRVDVRVVHRIPFVESLNPLFPGRIARYMRSTSFTGDYDLFILMPRNFRIPFRILSKHRILHLQVPDRPWDLPDLAKALRQGRFAELRNELVKRVWYPARYARFDAVLINSQFHRQVIEGRLKNPRARVLPPPISLKTPRSWKAKEDIILSVGRFFRGLHSKRHDVLIRAFAELSGASPGWRLVLAGGLNAEASAQEYFAELQRMAQGLQVEFRPNASLPQLNELYARARVYWHAAGFGADARAPERMEHFGISTVEAMSAGSVPVVFRGGGQTEIVQEGVCGFLWDSEASLVSKTLRLASAGAEAEKLSDAAVARSGDFSKERFVASLREIVQNLGG